MNQAAKLLREGADEIQRLRQRLQLADARVDTFEKCFLMVTAQTFGQPQRASPDVACQMVARAEIIEDDEAAKVPAPQPEPQAFQGAPRQGPEPSEF